MRHHALAQPLAAQPRRPATRAQLPLRQARRLQRGAVCSVSGAGNTQLMTGDEIQMIGCAPSPAGSRLQCWWGREHTGEDRGRHTDDWACDRPAISSGEPSAGRGGAGQQFKAVWRCGRPAMSTQQQQQHSLQDSSSLVRRRCAGPCGGGLCEPHTFPGRHGAGQQPPAAVGWPEQHMAGPSASIAAHPRCAGPCGGCCTSRRRCT